MPGVVKPKISPLFAIFLTVFIDLLSFGMFIPDLQLRGNSLSRELLGATANPQSIGFVTGATLGIFSLSQLLSAPFMGRLSDQRGRRSVLLVSCALTVLSYVLYAFATHIWALGLSRVLSGIAAANLGVAFAYVADVTTPQDRAKGLGLMGAAFGLGFILGPAIGALILLASHDNPIWLGVIGAVVATINLAFIILFVPESRPVQNESKAKSSFVNEFKIALRAPGLGLLLLMFFAVGLGFTNLESTYFLLLKQPDWIFNAGEHTKQTGALILCAVGVVGAFMQGYMVRILTPKLGELKMLRIGLCCMVPALTLVPFCPLWVPTLLVVTFLGVSNGLTGPSINSLISRTSPKSIQGGVFGITQSLGALARFIGPVVSNPLFAWKPYAPYLLGAGIILIPALLSSTVKMPEDSGDSGELVVGH